MTQTAPALPTFDIVDAASFGYQLAWAERHYLIRLATVPVLVSIVCQLIVTMLGWESNYLRQAMVMLPAYFAEGWMVCHMVRLVFLGQRWPFMPSGDPVRDETALDDRAYGIFAGTLVYVLIKMIASALLAFSSMFQMSDEMETLVQSGGNPPAALLIMQVVIVVVGVWAFRFLWVHIGVAAGYRIRTYLRAVNGLGVSVQMLGVSLLCFFPFFVVLLFITMGLVSGYHQQNVPVPFVTKFIVITLQVCGGAAITLINTAAIAQGFGKLVDIYLRKNPSA
ncbi:hypothetical protein [Micavibrio aeruginosavorus]|uniref:Transmembrane protein n=1 Tax=Micavibrio aeruginosavorus EPB TaxID=349215 RepID=M4VVF4_9BACT|nr:hypothetical protein [Micavibrio aeruginosavorus]AGH97184.1 hypothetical protein A11S_349 [Micavibrio aeruginosavorus EPB]